MRVDQKIKRYKLLIHRLETGQTVSSWALRYSLTKNEIKAMQDAWNEELESRKAAKPTEVKRYEKLLQKACLYYAMMERYSSVIPKKPNLTKQYANKADSAFEAAIEYLREIAKCSDIQMWMDRDVFGEISWDPISIPRVIGSKSAECLNKSKTPYPTIAKREIKIQVLQEAIKKLENKTLEEFMVDPPPIPIKRNRKGLDFSGFRF